MRSLILLCSIAAAQTPSPPKGSIEGRVVDLAGTPLKKAEVTLRSQTPALSGQQSFYVQATGEDGKFYFSDLDSDEYFVTVKRIGYVDLFYHEKSLKLDPGQKLTDIEARMTPQGIIAGKTIDEDGDPVPGLSVNLQRWAYSGGARRLVNEAWASSQADGSFIFGNLNAGSYIIAAAYSNQWSPITIGADRSGRESNLPTFYPNALDPRGAVPVAVAAGGEVRGLELRMRRGKTFDIRGRLESPVDFPYSIAIGIGLWLKTDDFSPAIPRFGNVMPKTLEFQFKNLIPGTYVIRAVIGQDQLTFAGGKEKGLVGQVEVTLSDGNVDNVLLPLSAGLEVAGVVKTLGDNATTLRDPGISLDLHSPVMAYSGQTQETDENGVVQVRGLLPEVYRVRFNMPDGYYPKGMRFNGQEFSGTDLDLRRGDGGDLQILLAPHAAEISGTVRDENGNPVSKAFVQVWDGDRQLGGVGLDSKSGYRIGHLPPGSYQIYAWEEPEGVTGSLEFRRRFHAAEVRLEEDSRETVDLKLILKTEMDAEAVKIP